jgi:ketosteroid isomerase-like protein
MKGFSALSSAIVMLLIISCAPQVDIEAERAMVKSVVDQFAQVFETEDLELFSRIMSHDEDMVNFGTDAAERWVGWNVLKESMLQQFASFENSQLSVNAQVIKVHESGNTAWFSQVTDWNFVVQGEPVSIKGVRMTGVLENRNGNWVIVQFHGSVPVAGQAVEY